MMLKAKPAFGDDDDSPSHTGLCLDFYVFKWVLTFLGPRILHPYPDARFDAMHPR